MARIRDLFAPILAMAMLAACAGTDEHVDDVALAAKITAALHQDPRLQSFPIDVESHNDVVQLSGSVHTRQDADHAQEIAANVPGVLTVYNRLTPK